MSNSAEYLGLVEGGEMRRGRNWWQQSACLFSQWMETRGAETTLLLPTTIIRFVRVMEGARDVLLACTLRVTDGSRLVDDRLSTKMPEERCTPGVFETTCLRPIDDVVSAAVLQWCFLLSKRLCPAFCQFVFAVEELMACGAGVASTESSTLCVGNITLSRVIHAVCTFFLVGSLVGVLESFFPNLFAETMKCSAAAHRRFSMAVD
ncbi:hypothetical protein TcYC6_0054680 [Trypanosoma cruzi]|nr:hypothetical protein TcYC6_0054680 [Trypanosoma cruzi]